MADQPWNHVYTDGDEWNTAEVYRIFAKAINERRKAIGWVPLSDDDSVLAGVDALNSNYQDPDLFTAAPGVNAANLGTVTATSPLTVQYTDQLGATVTIDTATARIGSYTPAISDSVWIDAANQVLPATFACRWNWPLLIGQCALLARYFVDADATQPEAQSSLLALFTGVPDYPVPTLADRAAWPGDSGWTRKTEREINAVADGGDDGQRARYRWISGISPDDETVHGTGIFDHTAGTWALSTDQASDTDILTSYGTPMPGDLFGPWILNDLQTAINDLRWTWCRMTDRSPATATLATWYLDDDSDKSINPNSEDATPAGDGSDNLSASKAAAEGAFPAAAGTFTLQTPGAIALGGVFYMNYNGSTSDPATTNWSTRIQVKAIQPAAIGAPNFCSRSILFYVGSSLPDSIWPGMPGDQPLAEFDANGTGLLQDQFHLVQTVGPTAAATTVATSITVGDPSTVPAAPVGPDGNGHNLTRGFSPRDVIAIIKWDVSGGFAYVAP